MVPDKRTLRKIWEFIVGHTYGQARVALLTKVGWKWSLRINIAWGLPPEGKLDTHERFEVGSVTATLGVRWPK